MTDIIETLSMQGGGDAADAPRPHSTEFPPSRAGVGPNGPAPVLSTAEVERALRKLADHELAIKRIRADAKAQRDEIAYWEQTQVQHHERAILDLRVRVVEPYAKVEIDRDPSERKSVTLRGGIIGYGPSSKSLVIEDQEALMHWLGSWRPNWLRLPSPPPAEPDKKAIKEGAIADEDGILHVAGQTVPGVRLVRNPGDFYVTTGAGGKRTWSERDESR